MLLRVVFLLRAIVISFDKTICLFRRLLSFSYVVNPLKHFMQICNSPDFLLKRNKPQIERKGLFNKQLRTKEVIISVLDLLCSQSEPPRQSAQAACLSPFMLIFIPVYFSIAPLRIGFVFTFRGLHRNSTRAPSADTLYSYVSVQAGPLTCRELHFTELESLICEKK